MIFNQFDFYHHDKQRQRLANSLIFVTISQADRFIQLLEYVKKQQMRDKNVENQLKSIFNIALPSGWEVDRGVVGGSLERFILKGGPVLTSL